MNFFELLRLTRPLNLLIVIFATIVSFSITGTYTDFSLFLRFLTPLVLLAAYGNVLNDIMDSELDKRNHPERPIPRGTVKINDALYFSLFVFLMLIFSIFFVPSVKVRLYFFVGLILIFLYDIVLKKFLLIGNFVVSLLTAYPFVIVAVAFKKLDKLWYPVLCAILFNLVREAVKNAQDFVHDAEFGYRTLPYFVGYKGVRVYSIALLILLVALSLVAFKGGFGGWVFLIYMIFQWCSAIIAILRVKAFSKLSMLLKAFMILILLGFLIGGKG
ncbi:MAG: UbiA family prenyltransferase [candidate division WOR-3 bacterium]